MENILDEMEHSMRSLKDFVEDGRAHETNHPGAYQALWVKFNNGFFQDREPEEFTHELFMETFTLFEEGDRLYAEFYPSFLTWNDATGTWDDADD